MIHIKKALLALFILFFSCVNSKRNEIISLLTNNSSKCWVIVTEYPIKSGKGQIYKIDGTYVPYFLNRNGERVALIRNEKSTWKLLNDSTIVEDSGIYLRIEYVNHDILVVNNLNFKQIIVYKRSVDQKTKPVADTTDHSRDL